MKFSNKSSRRLLRSCQWKQKSRNAHKGLKRHQLINKEQTKTNYSVGDANNQIEKGNKQQ